MREHDRIRDGSGAGKVMVRMEVVERRRSPKEERNEGERRVRGLDGVLGKLFELAASNGGTRGVKICINHDGDACDQGERAH